MTTEMFGSPFGFQSYDQDMSRLGQEAAVTRLHNANAGAAEQATAESQRQAQVLSQLAAGQPSDGALTGTALMWRQSDALIAAGLTKSGSDLANRASEIDLRRQQGLTSATQAQLHEFDLHKKALEEISSIAATVTDDTSRQTALGLWQKRNPGVVPPVELTQPYNPATFDTIRWGTAEGLKVIEQKRKQVEDDSQAIARTEGERHARAMEDAAKTLNEIRRQREERLGKADGKPISLPGDTLVQTAMDMLTKDSVGDMPTDQKRMLALDLATRAKALVRASPSTTYAQAFVQAKSEAEKKGLLKVTPKTVLGFEYGKEGTYKSSAPGDSASPAAKPVPLPTSKGDLKTGTIYDTAKGPAVWTGTGFKAAPAAAGD